MTERPRDLPPILAGVLILALVLAFAAFLVSQGFGPLITSGICTGVVGILGAARWITGPGGRGSRGGRPRLPRPRGPEGPAAGPEPSEHGSGTASASRPSP